MRKSRFGETQIVAAPQHQVGGEKARDVCRDLGLSTPTFYNWKANYGGKKLSELRRMKELEAENDLLKRMYADLSLMHEVL
jgi:putative transposase